MITITAKKDGVRRLGISHTKKPTKYPDDFFSDHQMKLLEGDENLVVTKTGAAKKKATKETGNSDQ
ncbi:MAG: HI1506-related protein [Desulfobulbaceae bacterium]|nr:HI1506-related protein [Desulfobulbaceae bacterium]